MFRKVRLLVLFLGFFLSWFCAVWGQVAGTSFMFLKSNGDESGAEWQLTGEAEDTILATAKVNVPWMLCETGLEVHNDFKVISEDGNYQLEVTGSGIDWQKDVGGGRYRHKFAVDNTGSITLYKEIEMGAVSPTIGMDSDTGNIIANGTITAGDKFLGDELNMSNYVTGILRIRDNAPYALQIKEDGNFYLGISSVNDSEGFTFYKPATFYVGGESYLTVGATAPLAPIMFNQSFQVADGKSLYIKGNSASAFGIRGEGGVSMVGFDTTTGSEAVSVDKKLRIGSSSIYVDHTATDMSFTSPDAGTILLSDLTGSPGGGNNKVVTVGVAGSGAEFTDIQTAIDSIIDESASNRYTVLVYPGTYTITGSITMVDYIDLYGVDKDNCIISMTYGGSPYLALIIISSNSSVSNLTVSGMCGSGKFNFPLYYDGATLSNFNVYNCKIMGHSDDIILSGTGTHFDNVIFDNCMFETEDDLVALSTNQNHSGKIVFKNCDFIALSTAYDGIGIMIGGSISFYCYFDNCSFINYSSTWGLFTTLVYYGNLYINSCRFDSNSSAIWAYGIRTEDNSKCYVFNSYFDMNDNSNNAYDLCQLESSNIYVSNTKYDTSFGTITPLNEGVKKFKSIDFSEQASTISLKDNTTSALSIQESTNPYIVCNTNNTTETIGLYKNITHPIAGTWTIDLPNSSNTFIDLTNSGAGTCGLKVNGTAVSLSGHDHSGVYLPVPTELSTLNGTGTDEAPKNNGGSDQEYWTWAGMIEITSGKWIPYYTRHIE